MTLPLICMKVVITGQSQHLLSHTGISKFPVLFKPIANIAQAVPISQQQGCLQFQYHRNGNVHLCKKRGLSNNFVIEVFYLMMAVLN